MGPMGPIGPMPPDDPCEEKGERELNAISEYWQYLPEIRNGNNGSV